MSNKKNIVLSISGGMDSTCLILKYLHEGYNVRAYSFDYGQRHSIELEKVREVAEELKKTYDFHHEILNVRDIFKGGSSALTSDREVPKEGYNNESIKATVVPIRNVIFASIIYSKALQWVYETGEDVSIALGVHANDYSVYPDCRKESVEAVRQALQISDEYGYKVSYEAPFVNYSKGQILESIKHIDGWMDIIKHTHSCYDPVDGKSCGHCATCLDRLEAFAYNGYKDPIEYVED